MNFERAFVTVTYLLILLGLWATYLTDIVSPPIFSGAVILWLLSFIIREKRLILKDFSSFPVSQSKSPEGSPFSLKNILVLLLLIYFILDSLFFSPSLLRAAVRFLLMVLILKLFDIKDDKDLFQINLIVLFQILSAAYTTISIAFFPLFLTYSVLTLWWLILFNFKEEERRGKGRDKKGTKRRMVALNGTITPIFFIVTGGVSIASFILTLFFFFAIPRIGIGFFQKGIIPGIKVSGFSEEIDLGEIGNIKLDPTVVMRVELPGVKTPPRSLFWRGKAFDYFDGFQWKDTQVDRRRFLPRGGFFKLTETIGRGRLEQRILLEPLYTNILFAAPYGAQVIGDFPFLRIDKNSSIYLPAPPFKRIEYTVYSSDIIQHDNISANVARKNLIYDGIDYSSTLPFVYLQTPKGIERVQRLAKDVTRDAVSPRDKAMRVEEYLKRHYRYNLNAPWDTKRPLESFLFDAKEGYCEQFATAMAILLRSVGVPTRLVTGFLPGDWNQYGHYFLVRQRDAHSWVEVYLPGGKWETFDPTPVVEVPNRRHGLTFTLAMFIDSLKLKWGKYIIRYSIDDQKRAIKAVKEKTFNVKVLYRVLGRKIKEAFSFITGRLQIFMGLLLIVIMITLLYKVIGGNLNMKKILEKIVYRKGIKKDKAEVVSLYLRMLDILRKKGVKKDESHTPWEFFYSLDLHSQEIKKRIQFITDVYYRIRFGGDCLSHREMEKLETYLKVIKERLPLERVAMKNQ